MLGVVLMMEEVAFLDHKHELVEEKLPYHHEHNTVVAVVHYTLVVVPFDVVVAIVIVVDMDNIVAVEWVVMMGQVEQVVLVVFVDDDSVP